MLAHLFVYRFASITFFHAGYVLDSSTLSRDLLLFMFDH